MSKATLLHFLALSVAWLIVLPPPAAAQFRPSVVAYPFPVAAPPQPPGRPMQLEPPPPLFVRFNGPPGMQITFYRGRTQGDTLTVPCTVGMRPGFIYRLQATGAPGQPGLTVFPTVEVRGSLIGGKIRVQDHPATVTLSAEDLASVARGSLVTKVVTLERPDSAVPLATSVDAPLEFEAAATDDPLALAERRGTPLLILRLGQRQISEPELVAAGLSGTILLPGEKVLPAPAMLPVLPWYCLNLYDPIHGPRPFYHHYCLPDGSDYGTRAGVGPDGRLAGLEPADSVAQYMDSKGNRRIAVSNRVTIWVPRFVVIRHEITTAGQVALQAISRSRSSTGGSIYSSQYLTQSRQQQQHLEGLGSRTRVTSNRQITGPEVFGQIEGIDVVVTLRGLKNITGTTLGPEEAEPADGPLLLVKWPDRYAALIGDIITFYLRYTNKGGRPIRNIVVSDSLGPRFEYVPGSARSDRDGVFTTESNEGGSLILRWEIGDELQPGQSGTVSFQARIR